MADKTVKGHTTSISDYELERGDGPEPCEGVEADEVSSTRGKAEPKSVTHSKVVEAEDKPDAKKTTAKTK
jgi:hypothetical protein